MASTNSQIKHAIRHLFPTCNCENQEPLCTHYAICGFIKKKTTDLKTFTHALAAYKYLVFPLTISLVRQ